MNRIQFFILTILSSVVALLAIGNIWLSIQVNTGNATLAAAQQAVQQGNIFQNDLKQLAIRILSDSQRTSDPALKDLLNRQQISYTPNANTNSTQTPASPSR